MEWNWLWELSLSGGLFILLFLTVIYPRLDPDRKAPKLTGPATVSALNAEYRHGWYYTGTFVLRDGEELQLTMLRHWYDSLKEGQFGWVTWQGKTLVEFEPNEQ